MAYFRCTTGGSGKGNTLVVTCADDLAGATITCTNGTKTYRKTCPSTAPYEVTFYGLEAGTWTVSATVSGNTYTTTVVVVDCAALLGGFNWRTWVDTAQFLDSSDYDSLDEVLADEKAVRELMTIHACVDYLANIDDEDEDVKTIIENGLCAKWINLNDYALDFLYANEIIADYMDEADKYFYGELAIKGVGIGATSNNSDLGIVTTDMSYTASHGSWPASITGQENAYLVFDGEENASGFTEYSDDNQPKYIQFDFAEPKKIYGAKVFFRTSSVASNFTVSYQNSNNEWVDLGTLADTISNGVVTSKEFYTSNPIDVKAIKITTKGGAATRRMVICEVEPLEYSPKGNVPIMTSATAPYGTVVNNGTGSTTPYTAFNGVIDSASRRNYVQIANNTGYIGYKFTNPISVKAISWRNDYDATTTRYNTLTAKVKYSDDGTNWTDAESLTITPKGALEQHYYKVPDNGYHLYWAFFPLTSQSDSVGYGNSFQFYGRELKSIVPVMSGYTAPYGTVTTSSDNDVAAWKGFRGISDSRNDRAVWATSATLPQYVMYESPSKWVLKAFKYENNYDGATTRSDTFELLISNDGTNFDNLGTFSNQSTANNGKSYYDLSTNNNEAKYFKINGLTKVAGFFPMGNMQFYGLDYTEKEFETGTTKKWLYDHGVKVTELKEIESSGVVEYQSSQFLVKGTSNNHFVACVANEGNLGSYNLIRAIVGDTAYRSTSNDHYASMAVYNGSSPSSGSTAVALSHFSDTKLPSSNAIDISQISDGNYPAIITKETTRAVTISIKEWWLE